MGWNNTSGCDFTLGSMSDSFNGNPIVKGDVCPLPFYSLAINASGDVSVCCVD